LISTQEVAEQPATSLNDFFEKVYVINLKRRPDRLAKMQDRLESLGVSFDVFTAIDGADPKIQSQYEAYKRNKCYSRKKASPGISAKRFYTDNCSDIERVAYIEDKINGPAIRSSGAWAYLITYRKLIEKLLTDGLSTVLVLDDDCLFHDNFNKLFNAASTQLPPDWKIFQLGTMQYNWEWTRHYSDNLYLPDGVIVASHAVGLHCDTFPKLLEFIDRFTLPFDIGPLHYISRDFREKSFVIQPNIAVQDQSESDINSSDVAKSEAEKLDNIYKWDRSAYA
jgi:GR25 family glycosyltransferase involved in LPS biosynthesis